MPIATPRSGPQTIGSLAEIKRTVGPTRLQRFDGQRTISLQVLPPEHTTVEEALRLGGNIELAGWTTTIIVLLITAGIQMIMIGVIGSSTFT